MVSFFKGSNLKQLLAKKSPPGIFRVPVCMRLCFSAASEVPKLDLQVYYRYMYPSSIIVLAVNISFIRGPYGSTCYQSDDAFLVKHLVVRFTGRTILTLLAGPEAAGSYCNQFWQVHLAFISTLSLYYMCNNCVATYCASAPSSTRSKRNFKTCHLCKPVSLSSP